MNARFKNWKDKGTREAIAFYAALGLLLYWGVRNFNVDELQLGAIIYIITGLSIFGHSKRRRNDSSEDEEVVLEPKQDAKRSAGDSSNNLRYRISWVRMGSKKLRPRFKPVYLSR